jgi:putative DNA primase/helicase
MTAIPARGTAMELSDESLSYGNRFVDICPIIPVPETAGVPDMTRRHRVPAYTWNVIDAKSQPIGFLCVYACETGEETIFWIYGKNRGLVQRWCPIRVPDFNPAIAANDLKARLDAIIIASGTRQLSDEPMLARDGPYDRVLMLVTFDRPTSKSRKTSGGSSNFRRPAPLEKAPSTISAPEQALVAKEEVNTSGHRQPRSTMRSIPSLSARRAQRGAAPDGSLESSAHPALDTDPGTDDALFPSGAILQPPAVQMSTIRAADVAPRAVSWLWQGRIPLGKVTMIVGYPGICKSLLGTFLAATVSRGATWPTGEDLAPKGSVLMVSTEDEPADTIVPRLQAADAEMAAVHLFQEVADNSGRRSLDLMRDIEALEQKAALLGDLKLIIIDPITACLGRANQNAAGDTRAVMMRLADFAARTETAVVVISHLNKGGSPKAITRTTGSLAFMAVTRVAFLVDKHPSDPDLRVIIPMKSNLGTDHRGLSFRVESVESVKIDAGSAPRLVFDSEPIALTADEVLNEVRSTKEGHSAPQEAKVFLHRHLAEGAAPAADVQVAAKAAGISLASLRRAKKDLGITLEKSGMAGGWRWHLP